MTADPLAPEVTPAELAGLRSRCPVSHADGPWYLARHDDVLDAVEDVAGYRASFREPGVGIPEQEQFISEIPEPRHGEIRRIVNSAIAAHRLGRAEPFCRELCGTLLDGLRERTGPVDLVEEYVLPVPNSVIAHLLGAPVEDFPKWAAWSDELVQGTYPTKGRNERGVGLAGAHPEFAAYVDGLIAARRAEPRDDFITRLIEREVDGRRLTDLEARSQLVFLFISGNETTRHLIGNLLHRLVTDPALYAALRADRTLVPAAVEESLRLQPPVRFLLRDVVEPRTVRGNRIAAGDKVAFGLESANRDEAIFDSPDDFRLDRGNGRKHLAFGGGPHVCPGQLLARLEARIALEELLDRAAELHAVDTVYENVPTFWARGPVRVQAAITWT